MAKKKKNTNKLPILLVVLSILFFSTSFLTGYYYKDEIFNLLSPRLNMGDEVSVGSEIKTPDSSSDDQLPNEFPKDLPIYQNAELKNSWTASGNATKGISVIWETEDSLVDAYTFYIRELRSNSWKILSEYQEGASNTITFEKDTISGFIGITKGEEGKTLISVTMGIGE